MGLWRHAILIGSAVFMLGVNSPLWAKQADGDGSSKQVQSPIAKGDGLNEKVQNPVAKMVTVPFQYNTLFGVGPGNDTAHLLNIQPVIPMSFGNWNIITRTIVPVIYVPRLTTGLDDVSQPSGIGSAGGLGDINFTAYLSPAKVGKIIWGVGPSISVPTGTDDLLGSRKWSMGPSAVVLANFKPWVVGLLARQLWSFVGSDRRSDVSQ